MFSSLILKVRNLCSNKSNNRNNSKFSRWSNRNLSLRKYLLFQQNLLFRNKKLNNLKMNQLLKKLRKCKKRRKKRNQKRKQPLLSNEMLCFK